VFGVPDRCGVYAVTLLLLFRNGELKAAAVALGIALLVAAVGSVLAGWEMLPGPRWYAAGASLDLSGAPAAARAWPSSTPHARQWSSPDRWVRYRSAGVTYYNVHGPNLLNPDGNGYAMEVTRAGWPLRVIERKQMWWDWGDPQLEGPVPDPAPGILYGRLVLDTVILGVGLWLVVFVPLGVWVVGRRVSWTLGGRCTFCGYDMTGVGRCPECGWERP
jgi:hypothetical protein